MAKVTMPQLGESVAEGTIGKWLKQPGDTVEKYEPLVEVITDKVNAEVPSPFAGILREILVEEGATVPNDAEIAVIETAEEGAGAADAPAAAGSAPTTTAAPKSDAAPDPTPSAAAAPDDKGKPTPPPAAPEPAPVAHGPAGSDERPDRAAAIAAPAAPTAVDQELEPFFGLFREHSRLALPFQGALLPDVYVAGEYRQNEQQHFEESKELQIAINHGPGEQKDRFDVE